MPRRSTSGPAALKRRARFHDLTKILGVEYPSVRKVNAWIRETGMLDGDIIYIGNDYRPEYGFAIVRRHRRRLFWPVEGIGYGYAAVTDEARYHKQLEENDYRNAKRQIQRFCRRSGYLPGCEYAYGAR